MFLSKSELSLGAAGDDEGAETGGDHALQESQAQTVAPVPTGPRDTL